MKYAETILTPSKIIHAKNLETEQILNNINNVGAKEMWEKGYKGQGVLVAVLDTGCDTLHSELINRVIGGFNFTNEHGGTLTIYEDLNGHGTHVAGIIAAEKNDRGIIGVAPEAKLLILKVLNSQGVGTISSIVKAIHYAIDWEGDNKEKVNIISMSLGSKRPSPQLHEAIKRAIKSGISVVVASGNDGDGNTETNEYSYPTSYEEVISVGAIDNHDSVADFTNTNEFVDIYAPGVSIKSSYINGEFDELSGTSMAAPHVAGSLALLINKYERIYQKNLQKWNSIST